MRERIKIGANAVWAPMVIPTLEILEPHFKRGTVLICDNVVSTLHGFKDFFARIKSPSSKYKTLTLPFNGGLEMATYWPSD